MRLITLGFPLWALLGATLAFGLPERFIGLQPAIFPLLALVMFGMGVTLSVEQFIAVRRRPELVALGLGLQFGVMPLAAWAIGWALALPPEIAAGLILVGACPGGTASNVVTYLAKGDVALSITLTTASTLFAIVLTPALTWIYLGEGVTLDPWGMMGSIAQVVIAPVAAGLLVSRLLGRRLRLIQTIFPAVSVLAIVLIIAIIVALNAGSLRQIGMAATIAVILHNGLGLAAGYWLARAFVRDEIIARTLSIEVGMQNSGLAAALAVTLFGPAAALPGALFSIWHNLSGAVLAAWWSRRPDRSSPLDVADRAVQADAGEARMPAGRE
jgi:BASS family bile acid:Na+ symporter